MLEGIINLVKDQVLPALDNHSEVSEDNKAAVLETTTSALVDGLKEHFTAKNISAITSLFSGESDDNTDILGGIKNSLVNALSERAGLSQDAAQNIASSVVPSIMSLFSDKANDPNDEGFNIESLIGAFTGGQKGGGGFLGILGSFFGKK